MLVVKIILLQREIIGNRRMRRFCHGSHIYLKTNFSLWKGVKFYVLVVFDMFQNAIFILELELYILLNDGVIKILFSDFCNLTF